MIRLRPIPRAAVLAAAVLAAAWTDARAQDFRPELAVVQINDVYRIDAVENGRAGGIGRVVTLVERTKREGRTPVMVLHAGDFIAPSLESRYFAGRQMIDALNFVHARAPLLAVPGNHEFDEREPAMFVGAIKRSRFPWLAGNVTLSTGDAEADRRLGRDTVITTAGGMKLGVFTLTFLDSERSYAKAPTDGLVGRAEAQIRALESRGADVIVGLTHLDHASDRAVSRLRATHPKFVWIAGGHEHYLLSDALTDSTALITKGDSNARRVWRVWLGRRGAQAAVRAEPVALDSAIPVDPLYARQVTQAWGDSIRAVVPFFDQVIGRSATRLDGTEEVVRNEESAWGGWLADQMRGAFKDVATDAAVLNGGAIRIDDAFQGEVRWEHLARTFGFPTRVGLVWLKGRDVRGMLENAVGSGRGEGRFLQVSGIRFRFDRSRAPGSRVTSVEMQQPGGAYAPLDDDRVYVVAVPDYLYSGGDAYTFHTRAVMSLAPGADLKLIAFDALSSAYARGQAIAPRVEGRIVDETPAAQR